MIKVATQFHAFYILTNLYYNIQMKKYPTIIAGPCSVENIEQICQIALAVKDAGADYLRGGAFKPRTSPSSWQGLGKIGLDYLLKAKKVSGLPVVTEVLSINYLEWYQDIDVLQVGARNMQNFELLKELGRSNKTILLKRGFGNTISELLSSAEYISSGGNKNIILCERGIRTFENSTRFRLDITAIPQLNSLGHTIYVDPSHASGDANLVQSLALASIAAGADGMMIECHTDPSKSIVDKDQAIDIPHLKETINKIKLLSECL